jgi:hypothetical protein
MKQNTIMQNDDKSNYKHVFVCGLGRSGTSVLARNVARLENCTGFKNTGVLEDEGQFLQDVYPTDNTYGGAAKFGFDRRAHLTEASPLLTSENAFKLRRSWERYWDASKTIRVEKTPGNLLRTRFLQAVFPNSYFIVLRRHPVSVSLANNQRWKVSFAPLHNLFDHWLHCHALFEEDKKYLKHVYELTYEDYIQNSDKYHQEIAAFIGTHVPKRPAEDQFRYVTQWRNPVGLRVPENAMEDVTGAHNDKYFKCWSDLLNNSRFNHYHQYIAVKYEPRFAKYGYSLIEGFGMSEERLREAEQISATAGALYCVLADAYALRVRVPIQAKGYIMAELRTRLPEPLKVKIKHVLKKSVLSKKQADAVS